MRITPIILAFCISFGSFISDTALAQQASDDYRVASELMREGEYERAFEIFYELLQDNPDSDPVFENTIEALIHLRDFERAIEITKERLDSQPDDIGTKIQLGELYHYAGDRDNAMEVWNDIVSRYPSDTSTYRQVASAMRDRRDYEGAIEIYQIAREELNNETLFVNELAESYLAASRYEEAMQEFLLLLEDNEHYKHTIQRQIIRFDEQQLYDVAILETEDAVDEHRTSPETANIYRNLLTWLYTERGLFDRALSTAKSIEEHQTGEGDYAVFDLARNLRGEHEFELAEDAYMHYIDQSEHDMRSRSMEELADTYQQWARYLITANEAYGNRLQPLYENAADMLEKLTDEYPSYERMGQVLVIQSELALDYLHDVEKARRYADKLEAFSSTQEMQAYHKFIEGRIKLFEGEFGRARIALTQSNRMFRLGEMAEQTNYYLSLSDFFSGDFEYAKMQLRALERQYTSFYANDALQLRLWIQEGTQQDEVLPDLELFAQAQHELHRGNYDEAGNLIEELLTEYAQSPLNTETLLAGLNLLARSSPAASLALLDYIPYDNLNPSRKEQILWERARIAHHLLKEDYDSDEEIASASETIESLLPNIAGELNLNFPENNSQIIELYEELLMEFPQGFYASEARNYIRELEEQQQAS